MASLAQFAVYFTTLSGRGQDGDDDREAEKVKEGETEHCGAEGVGDGVRPTEHCLVTDAPSLYQQALGSLRLLERFPQPDWSIADYRVARWLLQRDFSTAWVAEVLRQQSPGFPRSHLNPEGYLRRTAFGPKNGSC